MSSDRASLPEPAKYFFLKALRPFSLSVTVVTCSLGTVLAWHDGQGNMVRATMVMVAGLLLQSAVNLFNDHADIELWSTCENNNADNVLEMIRRNFLVAKIMTVFSIAIGLALVFVSGWELLVIGGLGLIGGYFYTGQPIAYKNRGWGVVAVFFFTGIFMVLGSYVAVAGGWSWDVMAYAVPVSMISSMLLLSNELRDVQDDIINNIGTFTVRAGASVASSLYVLLGVGALIYACAIGFSGGMRWPWLMVVPILTLIKPFQILQLSRQTGQHKPLVQLPPLTGRYFVIFGICMMLAI